MMRTPQPVSEAFLKLIQSDRPPVIMQILPELNAGGVEQGVIDINAGLVKAGAKSIVVSAGGKRVHEITRAGGIHIVLPVNSKNPFTLWRNAQALRKIVKEHGVSLIHACSRAPAWSAKRAARLANIRYVTSCHSAHAVGGSLKRYYNAAIAGGERVIAVSHFLSQYLQTNYNTDPNIIRVVHRGLDIGRFHPNAVSPDRLISIAKHCRIPDGVSVVTLPARITRGKGHMFLIEALAALRRPDLFCLMLGPDKKAGNFRQELEDLIARKGLESQVRIVNDCPDIPAAYMISTVVVAPSLTPEGFGRIPIECQAMGRPIIATNHGGACETIVPNQTGWLVEPNDVGGFADALYEAINLDPQQRALLATRSMAHVAKNFTVEKMCAETMDVYAELLTSATVALPAPKAA